MQSKPVPTAPYNSLALRWQIRSALANYGFLPPFSLNEDRPGPWQYFYPKQSAATMRTQPALPSIRVCLSIQLRINTMEKGLDSLLEVLSNMKGLGTIRVTIRDPEDRFFITEPIILEFSKEPEIKQEVITRLREWHSDELLASSSLPGLQQQKPGLHSCTRSDPGTSLPSVAQRLHCELIPAFQATEPPFPAPEARLRSLLFKLGRNGHDPASFRNEIARPGRN